MAIETTGFVRPYPQPNLSGKEGLTSYDVAKALGWDSKHVNQALGKRGYADRLRAAGCELVTVVTKSQGRGRPSKYWELDTNAAKIFVAQTRTEIGIGYCVYLTKCELIAEEVVPRLLERIKMMEIEISSLSKWKLVKQYGRKMWEVVVGRVVITDIYGNQHMELRTVKKPLNEMPDNERRLHYAAHNSAIAKGAAGKSNDALKFKIDPPKLKKTEDVGAWLDEVKKQVSGMKKELDS